MLAVLLLALIRFALALVGLAGAILRGVDATVALATFGFGVMILVIAVITARRRSRSVRVIHGDSALRVAIAALYPSSLGLAGLTVLSLVLRPELAPLMAGLLAGLALLAVAVAVKIAWARR